MTNVTPSMPTAEIGFLPELEFSYTEAMNSLATNLSFCGDHLHTLLITSRYAYEGKSFVSMNLMRTLASLGKRVVLLDADLRRSKMMSLYRIRFSTERNMGLAHYLAGMCEMQDIVYETNLPNAYLIPIGREVGSSLQLLSSKRLPELIERLRASFDMVLVDTPPAGMIVDALEIAKHCDGTLMVVRYNRGRKQDLVELVESINKTGCPVIGNVLNQVDFRSFTSRTHYYRSERYSSYYKRGYGLYTVSKKKK